MTKAMKATAKLQSVLQHAWGLSLGVASAAPLPSHATAVAQRGDAVSAGAGSSISVRSLGTAEGHHASTSLKTAHAAASLHAPDRTADVAPVVRAQPVWRPLPEGTVAALIAAVPGNCSEFVAVAEAELLEQPWRGTSGSKAGVSAQVDAEAGTSRQARARRDSSSRRCAHASGSDSRNSFMHVEDATKRYCAYEVQCSRDLFLLPVFFLHRTSDTLVCESGQ